MNQHLLRALIFLQQLRALLGGIRIRRENKPKVPRMRAVGGV